MDDFLIYDNARILARERPEHLVRMVEKTRQFNSVLLQFLRAQGLLARPSRWEGFSEWNSFAFRKTDLTDEGFALVQQCHDKWLGKIDRTNKIDMAMWGKALAKMRSVD